MGIHISSIPNSRLQPGLKLGWEKGTAFPAPPAHLAYLQTLHLNSLFAKAHLQSQPSSSCEYDRGAEDPIQALCRLCLIAGPP